jgi:hypothetical protein
MAIFLRQSTAVDVAIGPFVDSTDGVTPETALTISQPDVRLKKNNGAWAQVNDATGAVHEAAGWYELEMDATDTNTVGRLLVSVQESGALPVWHEFYVLEEAVFDALFAASATGALPVDLTQALGNSITLGNALEAAWAEGYGKWARVGTSLKLYAPNSTTVLREFTLDSATTPTSRTPV